jgi:NADP-dependent 3-hydroxy acid dehydrogenase YdfG
MRIQNLKNKKCLITGAGSGIGRSAAMDASKWSARLFLTDINAGKLKERVESINSDFLLASFDIRLMYWFKRKVFIIYHIIMKKLNAMMNDVMNFARL